MAPIGFQPEPNCGRGTINIVSNCLLTLWFCAWTIQHIDAKQSSFWWKIPVFISTILFPESLAVRAIQELSWALAIRKRVKADDEYSDGWEDFSLKQSFALLMGAIDFYVERPESADDVLNSTKIAYTLDHVKRWDAVYKSAGITDKDLDGRSKTDAFLKIITALQTVWFISAVIVFRLVNGYQLALLEIVTTSHVLCALVVFCAWFKKPQDLHESFKIPVTRPLMSQLRDVATQDLNLKQARRYYMLAITFGIILILACFALHVSLAVRAYESPTTWEFGCWIAENIVCLLAALAFLWNTVHSINQHTPRKGNTRILIAYALARMCALAQCFAALRKANPAVYEKPSWSNYWPHVGI